MAKEKKINLNFRKTALTKMGSMKPAREGAQISGGLMKPPKKGK